ncbi:SNARE associated golgi family protein [Solidesulfovibrio carbinoliphilus subsp. oakridgensis]|uniref:SNARE associated golgi family protein n=1 Tax=Solidesulfovibrio carbinoliphilus subsp. oakridgensis TaxID=694327 RepID=G7Q755_9BACT|nr:DedA family protein [Solidesulfovibrio carbinoliphilus]EHJ49012.1 SNARE associated golgi family protein [Solidesulfovibrio carbinoliphilus subsp. oakridgensis]
MDFLMHLVDIVLHVDKYLNAIAADYGTWTYFILFMIVFCETGLVVTPFLPGDSLLFATGALCGGGVLDPNIIFGLLVAAAFIGDNLNYWIGRRVGPAVFEREKTRFFKKEYLLKAHAFYERHGGKTVILARFVPIVRTFSPFVAGIARMTYAHFLAYSIAGAVIWVAIFVYTGYFFGNLPFIKKNFSVAILVIIFISILPGIIEYIRHRRAAAAAAEAE